MSYKVAFNTDGSVKSILKVDGNWWVPPDHANSDYQQYLAWIDEGNEPEEWKPE